MAKKSMIAKELKKRKLVEKYSDRREKLKATIKSPDVSGDLKARAIEELQKLPRDSSSIRCRNRCNLTGRPHGYYRKFGLSRNKLREAVMRGDVPGVTKASW